MRQPSLILLLVAGCASQGLNGPNDMASGPGDMPTTPVDLAGASCSGIANAEQSYIDAHKSCVYDSDCVETTTPCGLPGQCGTWLAASALAGLATFNNAWTGMSCPAPCPPCAVPAPAYCNAGTCAPLPFSDRPIGAPCNDDVECAANGSLPGVCLQGTAFSNGYCATACGTANFCPTGSLCRPDKTDVSNPLQCFRACGGDPDCRAADGYKCCPSWVSSSPGMVCYPSPCP